MKIFAVYASAATGNLHAFDTTSLSPEGIDERVRSNGGSNWEGVIVDDGCGPSDAISKYREIRDRAEIL